MNKPADKDVKEYQESMPPAGMVRADTEVDDHPPWDFEKGSFTGVVLKIKTVELIRRGEPVDVRMAVVEEVGGEKFLLWESANLGNFFDNIFAGTEIAISQRGTASLSGNRVMNLYDAFYKE